MLGVTGEEVADVVELVGDADAAGEEEDCAVGVEGFEAAVGSFNGAFEVEDAERAGGGAFVEGSCHARAFGDNEGDGIRAGEGDEVGCGVGESSVLFLFRRGRRVEGAVFRPGDGKGVRLPEGDGGEVDVCMASWTVDPGMAEVEGYAARFTGESFDSDRGDTTCEGKVMVDEPR